MAKNKRFKQKSKATEKTSILKGIIDEKTTFKTKMHFSFRHLDLSHSRFSLNECDQQYWYKMLERLKGISELEPSIFFSSQSKSLRAHKITWSDTSEKKGFTNLNPQLRDAAAYQFQISKCKHGRVHGFVLDNVFFVVWFDPAHKLYSNS